MAGLEAYYLENQDVYAIRKNGRTIRYSKERPTGMPVQGGPGEPATRKLPDGTPVRVHVVSSKKRRGK